MLYTYIISPCILYIVYVDNVLKQKLGARVTVQQVVIYPVCGQLGLIPDPLSTTNNDPWMQNQEQPLRNAGCGPTPLLQKAPENGP